MEPATPESLSVLYQSADFVVVNKRWDLRLDSKLWPRPLTLQAQLNQRFPDLADPGTCHGFRFCHQLDFSTSGALCVALNRAAAGRAYRCFKERIVTKAYVALGVKTPSLARRSCGSWNTARTAATLPLRCCC
uniref:RNA pseudouridine synthase domain containing 1 n=1 Tax=Ornithorhynchus anatinus TaxID=9258 RepID=K7ED03_ORNAN